MTVYEKNRSQIPVADLARYAGQWVAFSMDGARVLASDARLADLEDQLPKLGFDPEHIAFERIVFEDCQLGGAELSGSTR